MLMTIDSYEKTSESGRLQDEVRESGTTDQSYMAPKYTMDIDANPQKNQASERNSEIISDPQQAQGDIDESLIDDKTNFLKEESQDQGNESILMSTQETEACQFQSN